MTAVISSASAGDLVVESVVGGGPDHELALDVGFAPTVPAIDQGGRVYLVASRAVFQLGTDGRLHRVAGEPLSRDRAAVEGEARRAVFGSIADAVFDAAGNLFLADSPNNKVWMIDRDFRTATVFAGRAMVGPDTNGDGGPADRARLRNPRGVAIASNGDMFILEGELGIRRIDAATGLISTFYRAPRSTFLSALAIGPGDVLYVFEGGYLCGVRRIDTHTGESEWIAGQTAGYSGDGGPAIDARFRGVLDMAVDGGGNLFLSQGQDHVIRRIDAATGFVTTIAGTGASGFSGDGGPATNARFDSPWGIALGTDEALVVADTSNGRFRRVDLDSGTVSTIAGNGSVLYAGSAGPARDAALNFPMGLHALPDGDLLVVDTGNCRLRRLDHRTGRLTTVAGTGVSEDVGDGGPAASAGFRAIADTATDSEGNVFIVDRDAHVVRRIDRDTGLIDRYAGTGLAGFSGDGGPAREARLNRPSSVVVDTQGDLLIADASNYRIRKVDARSGTISTVAGTGVEYSYGDGGSATEAGVLPSALAVGPDHALIFAERFGHKIRRVDPSSGIVTRVAGTGFFGDLGDDGPAIAASVQYPEDVAVDSNGDIYIVDLTSRVRRVDARTGIISAWAGTFQTRFPSLRTFDGDGGPPDLAHFDGPTGLTTGRNGVVFVADSGNDRVRRVARKNVPPVAVAGADVVAECDAPTGAEIALDGSSSFDADGDPFGYYWSGPFPGGPWSEQSRPVLRLPLGVHLVSLWVNDDLDASEPDQLQISVLDTMGPEGEIVSPAAGACVGPNALPAKVESNFSDRCDPTPRVTFDPPGGEYRAHGDHSVTATATDASGNETRRNVRFTIDLVPPEANLTPDITSNVVLPSALPLRLMLSASDDDGATGGVVAEVLALDDCPLLDGATFGNRDGLLEDETVVLDTPLLCTVAEACGLQTLDGAVLRFVARDCGGNRTEARFNVPGRVALKPGICGL